MCGDAVAASVVVVTIKFVGFFLSTKFFVNFFSFHNLRVMQIK
jgi:hypothetical protein